MNSAWKAWGYLIQWTFARQWKANQMVWISLFLLGICTGIVLLFTTSTGWNRYEWRVQRTKPFRAEFLAGGLAHAAIEGSELIARYKRETKPHAVFSKNVVFMLYLGFLLPMQSLSFAAAAFGQDRENRTMIWLSSRPIPRWGIYLAKWLGVLPWVLFLNVGGFAILCLAGGSTGRDLFWLYLPSIIAGSLTFSALFHFFGSIFSRPAIVGLLYAMFFETILSELPIPGTIKRLSINYYVRCLMYSSAEKYDVPTESESLFVPVSDTTSYIVLLSATLAITCFGMWYYSRTEIHDDA
ncbi:MAG: ABC transporter permease [Zavarzinella sp.]